MSSKRSGEDSQRSAGSAGVKDARKKANERLGEWVKGKFRLDALLGVGGMASVYACTHRNGSRVALKILHPEFAREESIRERFLREGYVANKVTHPGVVRILDDDETDNGEPYLMMELLEGDTLRQVWKRNKRRMPVAQSLKIAAEILDTLVPCHDNKVIHRDLKPANIFMCKDGQVKILDFGVAQLREDGGEALTRAGTALGTPSYMAPEQAQGNSHNLDGRADVFSVGAILYTMLSGRRLLQGKSPNEAFILAATQPAPSLARSNPNLPVEVIALVDKALKWDRRKRFKDATEMRDLCLKILENLSDDAELGSLVSTHPSSLPPSSGRGSDRPSVPTEPPTRGASPAARRAPRGARIPDIPLTQIGMVPDEVRRGLGASIGFARRTPSSAPPPSSKPRRRSTPEMARVESRRTPHGLGALGDHPPSNRPARIGRPVPDLAVQARTRGTAPETPVSRVEARRKSRPPIDEPAIELDDAVPATRAPRDEDESPLIELFERFEKTLSTLRQYGLDHPEGLAKARLVHRAFLETLQVLPGGIHFQVHPFCFSDGPTTVWEPGPPNDQVPYGLASSGVEDIRIQKGVSIEEVRELLQITIIDPQLGLTEGDIGAAMWEAGFTHITCKVRDDLTDADAREQIRFFTESEEVEADVREDLAKVVQMMAQTARPNVRREDQVEAAAMALTTDTEMFQAAKAASDAMRLDYGVAKALAAELALDVEEWRDRFYDLAPEALADARMREDLRIIYDELARYADRWIGGGKWSAVLEVYDLLLSRLARHPKASGSGVTPDDITRELFTWPRVAAAFDYLQVEGIDPHLAGRLMDALSLALPVLGDELLPEMLRLADQLRAGPLCELALSYVGHNLEGHKHDILEMLDGLQPELAQRMLAALTHDDTPENRELLKPLLMSPNPALRCEATALLAESPEELGKQLVRLLASRDRRLCAAALTTMTRHQVRHAGPGLVQAIEDPSSLERPPSELRHMLETLYALNPPRAESLLTAIVDGHGLMSNDALDAKRMVAAEVLGRRADSANPLEALEGAKRIRPWNTQPLRNAAAEAVALLRERLAERKVGGSSP